MRLHSIPLITYFVTLLIIVPVATAVAGGGPLGIDYRLSYDNSGIWARSNQKMLMGTLIVGEVVGAVWEGGKTRLGTTLWRAIDSSALAGLSGQALKYSFTRMVP